MLAKRFLSNKIRKVVSIANKLENAEKKTKFDYCVLMISEKKTKIGKISQCQKL